jgi:hypothetical protein
LLSEDTHAWLADSEITVFRRRETGALNPETWTRDITGDESETVDAIRDDDLPEISGDLRTRVRRWRVLVADLPFVPSQHGQVRDTADNTFWKITRVVRVMDGREYDILTERID